MLDLPILKTPDGVAIIKFHGKHLRQIEMREPELSWSRWDPEFLDNIERMVDPNASWTAVHRGKVLLSFGIRTMTRNVGEAWLMPGKDISRYSISVVRCARKLFDDLLENKGFCRIQVGVMLDNDIALRFAKSLGFEVEGIMRNFGSPGASCALMSRISDHGIYETRGPAASISRGNGRPGSS